jgi:hypothetical protein
MDFHSVGWIAAYVTTAATLAVLVHVHVQLWLEARRSRRTPIPNTGHGYAKSRLPGPATRIFELELAELAMHPEVPDADHDETIRVSYNTTTLKANGAVENILLEECRRGR